MSVQPRKSARGKTVYDVFYRAPGGKRTCRRGLPKDIAYDLDDKMKRLGAMRRVGMKPAPTLSELAEDWLEFMATRRAASTVSGYKSDIEHRIIDQLGDRPLTEISPLQIQRYIDGLAAHPRVANKSLACLKGMFRQAVVWGYLEASPAHLVRAVPEPHKEREFLTYAEAQDVLEACEGRDRLFILTGLLSGLRPGELAGLIWEDVGEDYIRVRRSFSGGIFTQLKSAHARRDVLIPRQLSQELEAARSKPHYLVFPDKPYGPLPGGNITRHIVAPAVRRAGVAKHITCHDLRHTYACWLISQGESPKFVQEQLGHYSPEFTMRKYGHLMPDARTDAIRRFEKKTVSIGRHKGSEQTGNVIQFPQRDKP